MIITIDDNKVLFDFDDQQVPDFWAFRLMNDVFNDKTAYLETNIMGVCKAINTLSNDEQRVIILKYVDKLSYQAISKIFDRSYERIRQIHQKALRKLRHPSRTNEMRAVSKKSLIELERNMKAPATNIFEEGTDGHFIYKGTDGNFIYNYKCINDTTVKELNLSVRIVNCLMRAGINTLGDLINQTPADLERIPNIGIISLKEIKKLLRSYNISIVE